MARPPTTIETATLLSAGGIGYGALLFVWFSLPAYLAPIIDALGLTGTQAGVLAGAIPLTYIPLGLLSGLVIDRVGARAGIGVGIALAGIGQLGRAGAEGFAAMLALTLLMGVGATGLTFGLPKLAAELYPSEFVGRAASVYLVASYAGSATAFGLGRPVLGPALGGWRPLFFASGAATIALAAVWTVLARTVPAGSHETDGGGGFSLPSLSGDVRAVFAHRDLRLLVVLGTAYLFVLHGLQGWLVTLLEARGVDPSLAGGVTAVLVVGQVLGVLTVPALAERLDRTRGAIIACGIVACLGVVGLFFRALRRARSRRPGWPGRPRDGGTLAADPVDTRRTGRDRRGADRDRRRSRVRGRRNRRLSRSGRHRRAPRRDRFLRSRARAVCRCRSRRRRGGSRHARVVTV